MKKRIIWSALILSMLLLLGFFGPYIYWAITGIVRGEAFFDGRPTSYWRDQIQSKREKELQELIEAQQATWIKSAVAWLDQKLQGGEDRITAMVRSPGALPVWRQLMKEDDDYIREVAFFSILEHAQDIDLPALVDFSVQYGEHGHDFVGNVFSSTVEGIATSFEKKKAARQFSRWITATDAKVRLGALYGLTLTAGDDDSIVGITGMANDTDRSIRSLAIRTLGNLEHKPPEVIQVLQGIVGSEIDLEIQILAYRALEPRVPATEPSDR